MINYPFNLLTNYFVKENNIDLGCRYEICTMPAKELFHYNRFDLMAKWIYIDAKEKDIDLEWAIKIYHDNINAFSNGTFLEPGTESKNSFQKYLEDFDILIENIKKDGFDCKKSLIPVGQDNVLLDGAHRTAIAAYYNRNITVIKFPKLDRQYDYRYFRNHLMSDINLGYMAIYYSHLKQNCYMACMWPVAGTKLSDKVEAILRSIGKIVYAQDVYLTYQGLQNFMIQIYGHQKWVGSIDDRFEGIKGKARACYQKRNAVKTYLFEAASLDDVVNAKSKIRELFNIENHSIHISDNRFETEKMSELLYNKNSIEFLNFANPYQNGELYKKLMKLKSTIKTRGLDMSRFIADIQTVLEMYGLCSMENVRFISDYKQKEILAKDIDGDINEKELVSNENVVYNMLYNPEKYFCFESMKFISIHCMKRIGLAKNIVKDINGVKQCIKLIKGSVNIPKEYRGKTKKMIHDYQLKHKMYGQGGFDLKQYRRDKYNRLIFKIKFPLRKIRGLMYNCRKA